LEREAVMAGNFDNLAIKQAVEAPLMRIADQLATISQQLETQNGILARLREEQNNALHRIAEEATSK
jgi:hypothetical protein